MCVCVFTSTTMMPGEPNAQLGIATCLKPALCIADLISGLVMCIRKTNLCEIQLYPEILHIPIYMSAHVICFELLRCGHPLCHIYIFITVILLDKIDHDIFQSWSIDISRLDSLSHSTLQHNFLT